jgi:hypothetical protein
MGVIAGCCFLVSAKAQDEESPEQGQRVGPSPGEVTEMDMSAPLPASPSETTAKETAPLPAATRDPFWPVGYVPPPEKKTDNSELMKTASASESPQWDTAIKTLIIKGIMKSDVGYVAVINEQVASENDTISTVFNSHTYSWRVAKISEKGVQFKRLDSAQ